MISIDDLAREIADSVRIYTEEVTEELEQLVDETARNIRNSTEQNAPKKTGKYARGFIVTKTDKPGKTRRTVWNKKNYRLVHLLEMGHAKRGGGRVAGKPHLRPAYDQHADNFKREVRNILQGGGGS
jgi:hypothetical protein